MPRQSVRVIALLIALAVGLAANRESTAAEPRSRPNVVLIISDDQAWTDYGFMGHPDVQTPYLDRLAERSLLFERGYVASPLCRPSLASMVTGRFPANNGITANDVTAGMFVINERGETELLKSRRESLDRPVRDRFHKLPSFVRSLSENGYLTHQSGKWWEGSYRDGGFTHGMTLGERHGDEGLRIGREGMRPIEQFFKASAPCKGIKRDVYDGGIHVPMIVHWPKAIRQPRTDKTPWAFADVLPTFADLAGVSLNSVPRVRTNGVSIRTLLKDDSGTLPDRTLYWEFGKQAGDPNSGIVGEVFQAARRGKWKAVRYGLDAPVELYNIDEDPSESVDLSNRFPDAHREFVKLFEDHSSSVE